MEGRNTSERVNEDWFEIPDCIIKGVTGNQGFSQGVIWTQTSTFALPVFPVDPVWSKSQACTGEWLSLNQYKGIKSFLFRYC